MNYTLDQLMALDAIHRLGSFAAAAQSLFRATSAISYSIKSLEDALDVRLFDRSGHRAVLTPEGELVLAEARRVIKQARHLERVSKELQAGYEPTLPIVLDGILPLAPIMSAMQGFTAQELPTRVQLMVEYLSGVNERFQQSDAAIMLVLDYQGSPEYSAVALPKVEMFLVAHQHHPLNRHAPFGRVELADHVELVVPDSASTVRTRAHRLFLGSPQVFEFSDFHSKRQALLSGVGYGWLPDHLAREHLDSGELRVLPFEEGATHTFEPHLVYRNNPPMGLAGRLFVDLILAEMGLDDALAAA